MRKRKVFFLQNDFNVSCSKSQRGISREQKQNRRTIAKMHFVMKTRIYRHWDWPYNVRPSLQTHMWIHIYLHKHTHTHYALAYTYTPTHVNFSVMLPWKQSKHFKSILESKWRKDDKKVVEYSYHWILYHLFKKHLFCSSHWAVPHTDTHTQTCTCTHNVYNVTHTLHVTLHTHVDFYCHSAMETKQTLQITS